MTTDNDDKDVKPFTRSDVEVVERTTLYEQYFRVDHYILKHRLFEGGWSGHIPREIFERGHAVSVVLFDPLRDALVMIEQFRAGAYAAMNSPWFGGDCSPLLIEITAGIIEDGETPEEVARREAKEETGCEITDIVPLCHYLVSPGGSSESCFIFCGRVDSAKAGGIHGLSHEHENIRVRAVPVAQVFEWLDNGRINNAMTMIGLQWFRRRHCALRAKWSGT